MSTLGSQPVASLSSPPKVWSSICRIRSLTCSSSPRGFQPCWGPPWERRSGRSCDIWISFRFVWRGRSGGRRSLGDRAVHTLGRVAGGARTRLLELPAVRLSPVGERDERLGDRPAERREGVLDAHGHLGEDPPRDEAVALE